ncbi:hypothetical protein [Brachybacterium fresconis]|uniref:Nuclear transport factor 2 family protein n=1 Tax=Brachybacterium fresconis TaxID=173363 RepID=A0ABS4YEU5_9MICO|nr:hypothetical protein [Brachybacterium fresconis]MBP2407305.1 hypothetical protein [Brachybacterium fresconis]
MRTRHRALTALAMTSLVALPLAACSGETEEKPTEAAAQEALPSPDPADATPQERIEAYFEASDAAAAEGWKDVSFHERYLVPELSEKAQADGKKRAESGATISGERRLTNWISVEQTDTGATVEFCDDTTELTATTNGETTDISNSGKLVAQFKLVRESESGIWLIEQKGYYDAAITCGAHFAN